uniref:ARAD1D25718p n=1 Tax=Blastobotrys adeninivorans TaxID=409370 RepID=A0A060TGT2_BLAAD
MKMSERGELSEEALSGASSGASSISTPEPTDKLTPPGASDTKVFKSPSEASIAAAQIPSHRRFGKLVHKHEVPRKVFHVSIGFLTLALYVNGIQFSQVTPVLTALLVSIGSVDFFRLRHSGFNKLYCKVVGFLMREKEVNTVNGVVWYLLGLVIVFALFPKDISLVAVLLLSWADTAASTIGRAYGYLTPKIGSKSLAGTGAAYVTSAISIWVLYAYFLPTYSQFNGPNDITWSPDHSKVSLLQFTLVGGAIGAVSEAIDVFDDNLTIPVLSACFTWVFCQLVRV